MLAFKIMTDPFVGSLTFCRIYSGKVDDRHARAQLGEGQEGAHRPHAADARQPPRGHQGGLCRRHRRAGRPQGRDHRRHAVRSRTSPSSSSAWSFPIPSSRSRSSPRPRPTRRSSASRCIVSRRRTRPSACRSTTRSGQTIIKGMGELHLDIIVDRMRREFKVEANVGAPQVAYRETVSQARRGRLHPQEADRRLGPVRPRQDRLSSRTRPGKGYEFVNKVVGGNVPKEYIPGRGEGRAERRSRPACSPASRCSTSR